MLFRSCAALLSASSMADDWSLSAGLYQEELEVEGLTLDDETGYRIGFGRSLNEEFDLELEFGVNDFSYSDGFGGTLSLDYIQFGAMVGYKIPLNDSFTLLPKAGLGVVRGDLDLDDPFLGITATGSSTELIWKFGIHAEYEINDSLTANVGYRMENTTVDIDGLGDFDVDSSGLMFSVQFSF